MKHFVFTAIILSSAHAWALSQAQQNLTPGAGQNEIQIGAPYTYASYSNSSATATATGYMGAATYSYSFSENHSLAVGVGYGSLKTKIDPALGADIETTRQGVSDVLVGYRGNFDVGGPTLFTNLGVYIPAEKAKMDDGGRTNLASGAVSPLVELGVVVPTSGLLLGGSVKAQIAV